MRGYTNIVWSFLVVIGYVGGIPVGPPPPRNQQPRYATASYHQNSRYDQDDYYRGRYDQNSKNSDSFDHNRGIYDQNSENSNSFDHNSIHNSQNSHHRGSPDDQYSMRRPEYDYQNDYYNYQSDDHSISDDLEAQVYDYHDYLSNYEGDYLNNYQSDYSDSSSSSSSSSSNDLKADAVTTPPHINLTTPAPRPGSTLHAINFMQKFGYVPSSDNDAGLVFSPLSLINAIKRMQKFGGIEQTGVIDNATVELMQTPRCGLPDVEPEDFTEGGHSRPKRYIVGGEGWKKRQLTYYVANWSPQLESKQKVQEELRKAFDTWTTYSHLQFTEVHNNDADIVIFFASYDHGDGYAFDGESGILAHAYYPYEFGHYGGDVHFDESETWTIHPDDQYSGLDFFTVAVHEIGHSLGLAHSPVSGSIMFPYYKGYNPQFALDYDDVMAMWELYIKRRLEGDEEYFNSTTTTTTTTPRSDHQSDEEATDGEYDYEEEEERKRKEDEEDIYEKDRKRREEEEKRRDEERRREREEEEEERRRREEHERREDEVRRRDEEERRRWEEEERRRGEAATPKPPPTPDNLCEGNFDSMAVLRGELFIFKGEYLWRYHDRGALVPGYPAEIHTLFPALPDYVTKIDAVYERKADSNIIFFVGKYYFVHNGNDLVEGSPRPLTDLGIPEHITQIDAVFYWPRAKKTYFFTRQGYFRYNETSQQMDPGYPKHMSKWNGLPHQIDTVFTWTDGLSYFVSGVDYWRYDNRRIRPCEGYPQNAPAVWAKCSPTVLNFSHTPTNP